MTGFRCCSRESHLFSCSARSARTTTLGRVAEASRMPQGHQHLSSLRSDRSTAFRMPQGHQRLSSLRSNKSTALRMPQGHQRLSSLRSNRGTAHGTWASDHRLSDGMTIGGLLGSTKPIRVLLLLMWSQTETARDLRQPFLITSH